MKIDRIEVATAIQNMEDPFTCCNVMDELGLERNEENQKQVMVILHQFKERKWITNSVNNLFFRSFEEFRF